MRAVVVAGDRENAAVFVRAAHVGAMQGVTRAVHAGPLAVPHAVDAIDLRARKSIEFLRAVQHGGREVLVHSGLEPDGVLLHQRLLRPQFPIQAAQGRSAIAGNERSGVAAGRLVQSPLLQQQSQQRLDARQQHRLIQIGKARFQGYGGAPKTDVHGCHPFWVSSDLYIVGMAARESLP